MTRTNARELAVQLTFMKDFQNASAAELQKAFFDRSYYDSLSRELRLYGEFPDEKQQTYICSVVDGVQAHREELDGYISRYSVGWKLERISRTALAVMRCAICEILYMEDIPNAAAINEAVELDKKYDEPDTVAFVNGVLGGFMRGEFPEQAQE